MTKVTRRKFIQIGAAGTAAAVLAGCGDDAERYVRLEPYVLAPEEQVAGVPNYYATVCRACPAGCGIVVKVMNGRAIKLEGNPEHPVSRGKTCARGQSGLQLLYNPDRVPGAVFQEQRGSRRFQPLHWNEAINTLFDRISGAGGAVGIWLGSSPSDHAYDLFTRFAALIGAPAPLRYDLYTGFNGYQVLSAVNGTLFDQPTLPSYDLGNADVIFSFGADYVGTWLNATGFNVEYGALRGRPFGRRGQIVQFEPRMSNSAASADQWVPLRPGTEALVAQALVRIMADEGLGGTDRAARAQALASDVDLVQAAQVSGVREEALRVFARRFAEAPRAIALPGSALAGRDDAQAAVTAIQALNVIVGSLGLPGGMYPTPLPPAGSVLAPSSSTYADARDFVTRMANGEFQVLLIHGANPAYELPPAVGFAEALAQVGTVVSFNPLVDETSAQADFILPDRVFLESWGYDVAQPGFQGVPVVTSQQPVVQPLYNGRSAGDVLLTVAKGLPGGPAALPWTDEVAFIREQILLLPEGASGGADDEVRWARFQQVGGWWPEEPVAAPPAPALAAPITVGEPTYQGDAAQYPYYLHLYLSVLLSDGRGAAIPWLQGTPDPMTTATWGTWVELNPATAKALGVGTGDIVLVESPFGAIEAPVYEFPAIHPEAVGIPLGQGHAEYGRYARQRGANPIQLAPPDPAAGGAGNLGWSNVRVKITKTGQTKTIARLESTIAEAHDEAHIPF